MKVIAVTGKGGAGKSTISGGLALELSKYGKTLWLDQDKEGAALERVLSPQDHVKVAPNRISPIEYSNGTTIDNLFGCGIAPLSFEPIMPKWGRTPEEWKEYESQFPEGFGMVAYNDMGNQCQGFSANPESVSELVYMLRITNEAKSKGIDYIVLDLESTKGTKRHIQSMLTACRSMQNLKSNMRGYLRILLSRAIKQVMKQQQDWERFFYSRLVDSADKDADEFRNAMEMIIPADYVLVCGTQKTKVDETLKQILPMIKNTYTMYWPSEKKGDEVIEVTKKVTPTLACYVVNRSSIDDDPELLRAEQNQIRRVEALAKKDKVKAMIIPYNRVLQYGSDEKVLDGLKQIGMMMYGAINRVIR